MARGDKWSRAWGIPFSPARGPGAAWEVRDRARAESTLFGEGFAHSFEEVAKPLRCRLHACTAQATGPLGATPRFHHALDRLARRFVAKLRAQLPQRFGAFLEIASLATVLGAT